MQILLDEDGDEQQDYGDADEPELLLQRMIVMVVLMTMIMMMMLRVRATIAMVFM